MERFDNTRASLDGAGNNLLHRGVYISILGAVQWEKNRANGSCAAQYADAETDD